MLAVGIVGLPNVGKSTLFNALTAAGVAVSNYPFTTIDPNVGVVAVPDPRLDALAAALAPEEAVPCCVRFVDIAGLVAGASRGEGLGNRFLGEIRGVDAIAQVVRAFPAPDVVHVHGEVDPLRDAEVVETELLLADLEVLERATEKRRRVWATSPRDHGAERDRWTAWRDALAAGRPLAAHGLDDAARREAKALGLLTAKPLLYVVNVGEEGYGGATSPAAEALRRRAAESGVPAEVVEVSARLEAELAELAPEERRPFLADLGLERSGLERLAEAAFRLLDLLRFYTIVGGRKLRAWEIPRGATAPEAAGRVHSDMQQGFIRARVTTADELAAAGDFHDLVRHGRVRTEGREYAVRDGDVVEFSFAE
jgi:GTP-binding protein YchF